MRYEELSVGELTVDSMAGAGANPGWRKKIYLNAALGSDGNDGLAFDRAVKTLTCADDLITTLKKDLIVLEGSASAISLAAAYTWDKSICGIAGTEGGRMNQRSRIGMSTTFSPFFTISGYGNSFSGLYFQHGTAQHDHAGLYITGSRNSFERVHVLSPMVDTQGTDTDYTGAVQIVGAAETFFKDCVIGSNTADMTGAVNPLIAIGAGNGITIFENCLFILRPGATTPHFAEVDNASDTGLTFFNNCRFVATGPNAIAEAFHWTGSGLGAIYIDPNCQFYNVTALVAAAHDSMLYVAKAPITMTNDHDALIASNNIL